MEEQSRLLVDHGMLVTTVLDLDTGKTIRLHGPETDRAEAIVGIAAGGIVHVESTGFGLGFAQYLDSLGVDVLQFRFGAA